MERRAACSGSGLLTTRTIVFAFVADILLAPAMLVKAFARSEPAA